MVPYLFIKISAIFFLLLGAAPIRGWVLVKLSPFSAAYFQKFIFHQLQKKKEYCFSCIASICDFSPLLGAVGGGAYSSLDLINFLAIKLDAYSRWALNQINTVFTYELQE